MIREFEVIKGVVVLGAVESKCVPAGIYLVDRTITLSQLAILVYWNTRPMTIEQAVL